MTCVIVLRHLLEHGESPSEEYRKESSDGGQRMTENNFESPLSG